MTKSSSLSFAMSKVKILNYIPPISTRAWADTTQAGQDKNFAFISFFSSYFGGAVFAVETSNSQVGGYESEYKMMMS